MSRSKSLDVVIKRDGIYRFFLQDLRAIIRSSPPSSPSKLSDIRTEVALFEERVQPIYVFEFEEVDISDDELSWFDV